MLRSLWFILQIAILTGLLIWAAQHPGTVTFNWLSYELTIQIGLFLCAVYALIFLTVHAHNIWRYITGMPRAILRRMEQRAKIHSHNNLAKGLSALAAGDLKSAARLSHKINDDHFNESPGLLLLLQAQTARLKGNEHDAKRLFSRLAKDKNAGFLGVRALLQNALENNDFDTAKTLAQESLQRFKNNPWLLQAAYKIALQSQQWDEALAHIKKLEQFKVLPQGTINSDKTALYIAMADQETRDASALKLLQKAHKITPEFPPLIARLVKIYQQKNQITKAQNLIKSAWKKSPHLTLVPLWVALMPESRNKKSSDLALSKWCNSLLPLAPDAPESHYAAAQAALKCGLWGEARGHFLKAYDLHGKNPPQHWYRSMAALERAEKSDEDAAQEWLIQGSHAPEDKVWLCQQSGHIYPEWTPVAAPHNSFNTIHWQRPLDAVHTTTLHQLQGQDRLSGLLT